MACDTAQNLYNHHITTIDFIQNTKEKCITRPFSLQIADGSHISAMGRVSDATYFKHSSAPICGSINSDPAGLSRAKISAIRLNGDPCVTKSHPLNSRARTFSAISEARRFTSARELLLDSGINTHTAGAYVLFIVIVGPPYICAIAVNSSAVHSGTLPPKPFIPKLGDKTSHNPGSIQSSAIFNARA